MKPSFAKQQALRTFSTLIGTFYVFNVNGRERALHETNRYLSWPYSHKVVAPVSQ